MPASAAFATIAKASYVYATLILVLLCACCGSAQTTQTASSPTASTSCALTGTLPPGFGQVQAQLRAGVCPDSFKSSLSTLASITPGQNGDARYVQGQNSASLFTLSGSGVAQGLVDLQNCALWSPHFHPRANEILYITKGKLNVSITEENAITVGNTVYGGRILNYTLGAGESLTIPQGLIHYIYNPYCEPAEVITFFDNKDPGTTSIVQALFKASDTVVSAATGLDALSVNLARARVAMIPFLGVDNDCRARCALTNPPGAAPQTTQTPPAPVSAG